MSPSLSPSTPFLLHVRYAVFNPPLGISTNRWSLCVNHLLLVSGTTSVHLSQQLWVEAVGSTRPSEARFSYIVSTLGCFCKTYPILQHGKRHVPSPQHVRDRAGEGARRGPRGGARVVQVNPRPARR